LYFFVSKGVLFVTLILKGKDLTIQDIKTFLEEDRQISISEEALINVRKSRETVERIINNKETVYGITTGFGLFSDVLIEQEKYNDLQINLIRSHSCGVGKAFPDNVSLVKMILRLNTMLKGHSGVTEDLVNLLVEFINRRIIPVIPEQGSLGASGDLAPLSHLALALIGEGDVHYKGETLKAKAVLHKLELEHHSLQAKEGLALINGTQAMTAQGVIAYIEAENIAYNSEWIASLTHQALNGIVDAYDEHVHIVRNFNEQIEKIWQTVKEFMQDNFALLTIIEKDLIADSQNAMQEYQITFSKMTEAERKEKLGFSVPENEINQFCHYMADMHEVQAIVLSAGAFANHELLGKNSFTEMISDNIRRSTLFWVLDNTFYEIYYYFYMSNDNEKLHKRLKHQREALIVNMRNDAFHRAQEFTEKQVKNVDFNEYFSDIFIPVAEQIIAEVNKFKD